MELEDRVAALEKKLSDISDVALACLYDIGAAIGPGWDGRPVFKCHRCRGRGEEFHLIMHEHDCICGKLKKLVDYE